MSHHGSWNHGSEVDHDDSKLILSISWFLPKLYQHRQRQTCCISTTTTTPKLSEQFLILKVVQVSLVRSITMSTSSLKTSPSTRGLPPIVGMIGSIAFFLTLFSLANPNREGYAQFRKCHGNCVNGILHFVGMPMAVSGVFLIVRSVSDHPEFTRHLSFVVTTSYLYLYLQYESHPYTPWLFYAMYMSIWEFVLYRKVYGNPYWSRLGHLVIGILLVLINVGALESIGHGLFEHQHSYVLEFFNVSPVPYVHYVFLSLMSSSMLESCRVSSIRHSMESTPSLLHSARERIICVGRLGVLVGRIFQYQKHCSSSR